MQRSEESLILRYFPRSGDCNKNAYLEDILMSGTSFIAVYVKVEYLLTLLTIINAGIVAYVALRQHQLAKDKLKLDLFEKRFDIYKSLKSFIEDISNPTIESKVKLYKDTQEAVFLFEDDIIKYLDEILEKASKLYAINKKPLAERVQRDHDMELELLSWYAAQITGQYPELTEIFSPYLKFKTWK